MEFISVLNKLPKNELVKLARKHNALNKIPNINKLKKHDLIVELLMHREEIEKIYYSDDNDKSLEDIKKEKGQKIRGPPKKEVDKEKNKIEAKKLFEQMENINNEIQNNKKMGDGEKLKKFKQIGEIREKFNELLLQ